MKAIEYDHVTITNGFWKDRQQLNRDVTTPAVYRQFKQTGRIGAFEMGWKSGEPNQPHFFWDSDVAKWMEGAAYQIKQQPDPILEAQIDSLVDNIAAHQQPDGYFNIYFTVVEPGKRFTNRDFHELYCAGHLIEAAIAYDEATGKDKFLNCMLRYADLIDRIFHIEKTAPYSTPGHEEIELALVKLSDYTNDMRWLNLAKYFLDQRGVAKDEQHLRANQSHLPVRQQLTAEGHAVRAVYLYCGMADVALRCKDAELSAACKALFENIVTRRMYISGGIGSSRINEAFTVDYDLPNLTAYSESCAAIGLILFCNRMQTMASNSLYGDVIERVLYNAFLSSTSLDGKSFFYENPLEIRPELIGRNTSAFQDPEIFPITQRVEMFGCSCCPPNIVRFVSSVGGLLYTTDEDSRTIYCHQFMSSRSTFCLCDSEVELIQTTCYPVDGHIHFTYHGPKAILAIRVPGWVSNFSEPTDHGFVKYSVTDGSEIDLNFTMTPYLVEADPRVQENSGRFAVMRGPVVYCIESVDNGANLRDITLQADSLHIYESDVSPELQGCGLPILTGKAFRRNSQTFHGLYEKADKTRYEEFDLKLIPYFSFANRGESEMLIWLQAKL